MIEISHACRAFKEESRSVVLSSEDYADPRPSKTCPIKSDDPGSTGIR